MKREHEFANREPRLLWDVWNSMALQPPQLNCEEKYYQAKLLTPEFPQSVYRCVANPRPRGRPAFQDFKRGTLVKPESPHSYQTGLRNDAIPEPKKAPLLDRSIIEKLKREIEIESRQEVCLLALKKKIARFYYGLEKTNDTIPETKRIRRKRGRPPKRKTEQFSHDHKTPPRSHSLADQGPGSSSLRLRVRLPRARTAGSLSMETSSRELPNKRSQSWTSSGLLDCSLVAEKEDFQRELPVKDEELALQLHVDLNAPRLRKRLRSNGLLSPSSNSEQ